MMALQPLPAETVPVTDPSGRGPQQHRAMQARLDAVLPQATRSERATGKIDPPRTDVRVAAGDGYEAGIVWGALDPVCAGQSRRRPRSLSTRAPRPCA